MHNLKIISKFRAGYQNLSSIRCDKTTKPVSHSFKSTELEFMVIISKDEKPQLTKGLLFRISL